jgi:hypothetical protein
MSELTQDLRDKIKQRTLEVLDQPGSMQRFAPSPLATINPAFRNITSFLPTGAPNPYAGDFQQQRTPSAQYVNYERAGPNVGGPLTKPQPPAGFVPAGTQPEVIRVYPDGSPAPDTVEDEFDPNDPDQIEKAKQEYLDDINNERMERGLDPYDTFEDYMNAQIGSIGMYEGGIASLDPMMMSGGGIMSTLGNIASTIGGGIKNFGTGMKENFLANMAGTGPLSSTTDEKRLEDMTREELIEYIKTGKKPGQSGVGFSLTDLFKGRPQGGTAALREMGDLSQLGMAEGGDVDFPRMNGPISGPGTETSDDIPAMLSDGEFVVNAKAVRGIGRLKGAGKSKAEQRQEGARMMYALQRAGEQAMRKA